MSSTLLTYLIANDLEKGRKLSFVSTEVVAQPAQIHVAPTELFYIHFAALSGASDATVRVESPTERVIYNRSSMRLHLIESTQDIPQNILHFESHHIVRHVGNVRFFYSGQIDRFFIHYTKIKYHKSG